MLGRIGIWKCWFLRRGGKPEYWENNLSEQGREPATYSTHIWHRRQDSNPGHIGGRGVLSPIRASDISWKKKQDFAGFSGANSRKNRPISRKNRPISRDFRGKKVKLRGTISRFRGILAEKSQFSKDFRGQILRKISRFHRKFRGETSPRNNQ